MVDAKDLPWGTWGLARKKRFLEEMGEDLRKNRHTGYETTWARYGPTRESFGRSVPEDEYAQTLESIAEDDVKIIRAMFAYCTCYCVDLSWFTDMLK